MRLCVNINAWESLSGTLGVMLLIVYKRYLDVSRGLFRGNASRDILANFVVVSAPTRFLS